MKKQIIFRSVLLCTAVTLACVLVSALLAQRREEVQIVQEMKDLITVVSRTAGEDPAAIADSFQGLSMDYRLTILDLEGNVLADSHSDPSTMENHLQRPEVRQAVLAGFGKEKRYSETLHTQMEYVAFRDGSRIYRAAAPLSGIRATFAGLIPAILAGVLLSLLVSPLLAASTANSLLKPLHSLTAELKRISSGDYQTRIVVPEFEELIPAAEAVNTLVQDIAEKLRELSAQREKTGYLLDNMQDGLILVDGDMRILQINAAARACLQENGDFAGKSLLLLTRHPQIISAAQDAVRDGTSALFDLEDYESSGTILSVHVTAVRSDWMEQQNGAVLLLTDVTRERQTRRIRSEFVANASHELKTPITSISGFAELLHSGAVGEEEQKQDYLRRICAEASRMNLLIEDILKLSRLESGEEEKQVYETVAVDKTIQEVRQRLDPQIRAKSITVETDMTPMTLQAWPDDVKTLVTNLLDNAVKYNTDSGAVRIALKPFGNRLQFSVADTGIGIPAEAQSRLFERFYRVDKGRSREIGGTGLGLAIVKHIVLKYGGEIFLQSAENSGTVITVRLPGGEVSG